ncbi:hypothetical protein [Baia soyae]|uniref:Uncharacterized protein n=1 Tax=Baia soyae TaxID=1544746 RepID=A0A4R2RST7_9BACL|nr:hypothetical protein [Baia soyae]TCP65929.1 hypothetical protein EDD57_12924 [Baia soyae]
MENHDSWEMELELNIDEFQEQPFTGIRNSLLFSSLLWVLLYTLIYPFR